MSHLAQTFAIVRHMPAPDLLDPKLDVVFKRQFASQTNLLINLINAVRSDEVPVVELDVLNPEILPEELTGKFIVLDILAVDEMGQRYNIEMQANLHAGWTARSVYYLARALGTQLQSGESYQQVKPVIGIHLMNFDLFDAPDQACWRFEMRDHRKPDVVLDRGLQLHMIELPKADRLRMTGSNAIPPSLLDWITYFQHWREETVMRNIQQPAIQKAYQHLHVLSEDETARRQAFVRERALRDEISEKFEAEARGEARGRAELLLRLLRAKFDDLPMSVEHRLQTADSAQLEHWAERVLFADTLDQVFSQH